MIVKSFVEKIKLIFKEWQKDKDTECKCDEEDDGFAYLCRYCSKKMRPFYNNDN